MRRIGLEPFVLEATVESLEQTLLIGAVDGSMQVGILSLLGEGQVIMSHFFKEVRAGKLIFLISNLLSEDINNSQIFLASAVERCSHY